MRRCCTVLIAAFLVGLVGCATTLPPAQTVSDVKVLAGTYDGWISNPNGNFQAKLTVQPDGSYVGEGYRGGAPVAGRIYLFNSQTRYESPTSKGTVTLHDGDGKRVLRFVRDDGSASGEFTPVK
jgi:hypothetical protein